MDLNRDGDDNAYASIPQIKAAVEAAGLDGRVEFLGARGSNRAFFRCDGAVIVVYDDSSRRENALYAGHARFLRSRGVPVPEVLADMPGIKTLVLEDVGGEKKMSIDDYAKVVEELVRFNALGGDPELDGLNLLPGFDDETWAWERGLFRKYCLGSRFRREMPKDVETELEKVAVILENEPKALVHRDFQSTNVLWKNGKPRFIDFQGMRLGPAAYDLASLVYDPYVAFTDDGRKALVALYAKKCGRAEIEKVLPVAAVQRLVQCLGAYGRLASVGQPQFCKWVQPALQNLLAAADESGLDAVGALAEDLIAEETRRSHVHKGCSCGNGHEGE